MYLPVILVIQISVKLAEFPDIKILQPLYFLATKGFLRTKKWYKRVPSILYRFGLEQKCILLIRVVHIF